MREKLSQSRNSSYIKTAAFCVIVPRRNSQFRRTPTSEAASRIFNPEGRWVAEMPAALYAALKTFECFDLNTGESSPVSASQPILASENDPFFSMDGVSGLAAVAFAVTQ
jgi:hypothetical protein